MPAEEGEGPLEHVGATRAERRRTRRPRRRRALIIEWGIVLVIAVLLAFGLRSFAFQAYYVPTGSMIPTLDIGDRIVVDKLFFHPKSIAEGNVVVFRTPPKATLKCDTTDADLVKRVIGLPGESLYSIGNAVYVNGTRLAEPYLPTGAVLGPAVASQAHPIRVPANSYFVMGDNRSISCDSRYWGFVPASAMIGKVAAVIWRHNHPVLHLF